MRDRSRKEPVASEPANETAVALPTRHIRRMVVHEIAGLRTNSNLGIKSFRRAKRGQPSSERAQNLKPNSHYDKKTRKHAKAPHGSLLKFNNSRAFGDTQPLSAQNNRISNEGSADTSGTSKQPLACCFRAPFIRLSPMPEQRPFLRSNLFCAEPAGRDTDK